MGWSQNVSFLHSSIQMGWGVFSGVQFPETKCSLSFSWIAVMVKDELALVRDHVPLTTGLLVTSLTEALPALSLVLVVPNVFNSQ